MSFQKEEIAGIFGRNGTGKSSLMKIIFGILKHDQGIIEIDKKVYSQKEIIPSQEIGYLPQETFLPKNEKVQNIIPFFFPVGSDQDKVFYSKGVGNFTQQKNQTTFIRTITVFGNFTNWKSRSFLSSFR